MISSTRLPLLGLVALATIGLAGCSGNATSSTTPAPITASSPTTTPTQTVTPAATTPTSTATATASASTQAADTFTLAQVKAHNTATSCYVAIDKSVYDLTKWITNHPGGQGPITGLCGTDGSAAFNAKHGEDGPHGKPQTALATFKIGILTS